MIVGITGGIGSGKSTIVSFFKEFKNIAIYIADDEAKKLMHSAEIKSKIIAEFGKDAFLNNQLNRKLISSIVFKDKTKLLTLNNIVHPAVKNHFQEFIKINKDKEYIIYENAILFENKNESICDVIICVTIPISLKIERVMQRDKVSREAVEERMKNQWKEAKKLMQSNYIIHNFEIQKSKSEVKRIHNILTKKDS